jgi:hypothetical protein
MKEKLTLRNIIIWGAAFLGLLFFFLSFAAKAQMYGQGEGGKWQYVFTNAIWSDSKLEIYLNRFVIKLMEIVRLHFKIINALSPAVLLNAFPERLSSFVLVYC